MWHSYKFFSSSPSPFSFFRFRFSNASSFSFSPPSPSPSSSLHSSLLTHLPNSAQAFHDAFSDFIAWLRDTERKIQRDDPLKLEVEELKTGLTYLQVRVSLLMCAPQVFTPACVTGSTKASLTPQLVSLAVLKPASHSSLCHWQY